MARTGVSLEAVEAAILELQGKGRNPSIDAIRELLGTGSKSTISAHVQSYKAKQSDSTPEKLPPELVIMISNLWEHLNAMADKRIAEIENNATQRITELENNTAQLKQEIFNLEKQLDQSDQNYIIELAAKENFQNSLILEQQEHAKALERYENTLLQLNDHRLENMRLHQLANNMQTNLEHYQNAIQQLRTEQDLEIEKQKEKLSRYQAQHQELENKFNYKNLEFTQLESKYYIIQDEYKELLAQVESQTHELIIYKTRCEQLEKNIQQAENKVELLQQEKICLIQKKYSASELKRYFNQLQMKIKKCN